MFDMFKKYDAEEKAPVVSPAVAEDDYAGIASLVLEGVGGKENVTSADHCITRLRLEVKDQNAVDEAKLKAAGATGVVRSGKTSLQVVMGLKMKFVADEFMKICK